MNNNNMNRGRGYGRGRARNMRSHSNSGGGSWRPVGDSSDRNGPVGADRRAEDSFGGEDGLPVSGRKYSQQISPGSVSKHSEHKPNLGSTYRQEWCSRGRKDGFSNVGRPQQGINSPDIGGSSSKQSGLLVTSDSAHKEFSPLSVQSTSNDLGVGKIHNEQTTGGGTGDDVTLHHDLLQKLEISGLGVGKIHNEQTTGGGTSDDVTLHHDLLQKLEISGLQGETLHCEFANNEPPLSKDPKNSAGDINSQHLEHLEVLARFDLCPPKTGTTVMLKAPLLVKNRERRNEMKRTMEGLNGNVLRPGMVLLKSYISSSDQVKLVKKCRDLGLGPGGFYQPGYRDGAKLNLKMMCLGKNWDPETSKYGDHRPIDEAKPPIIPSEFYQLVEKAIKESHALIKRNSRASNVEELLPWMSPNICLVNFYSSNGRLGLHQDRDETQESLRKGLPVVSFSIGDSADFLYGDERDVDQAQKVVLESGDVLIFGGKSRHIFHGVSAIHPNTAPKHLQEETNLRPGRMNLTFRQY